MNNSLHDPKRKGKFELEPFRLVVVNKFSKDKCQIALLRTCRWWWWWGGEGGEGVLSGHLLEFQNVPRQHHVQCLTSLSEVERLINFTVVSIVLLC